MGCKQYYVIQRNQTIWHSSPSSVVIFRILIVETFLSASIFSLLYSVQLHSVLTSVGHHSCMQSLLLHFYWLFCYEKASRQTANRANINLSCHFLQRFCWSFFFYPPPPQPLLNVLYLVQLLSHLLLVLPGIRPYLSLNLAVRKFPMKAQVSHES